MSAASRLADAETCFVPSRDPATGKFVKQPPVVKRPDPSTLGPQLGKNAAGVAGGLGFQLPAPVIVAGIVWRPEDGDPFASPIGTAIAAEMASRRAPSPRART